MFIFKLSKIHKIILLLIVIIFFKAYLFSSQKTISIFSPSWQNKNLEHQFEATGLCYYKNFVYIGGASSSNGKITKISIIDGIISWSIDTNQSYQPSYPVSNGKVVVFGNYYKHTITCIDDKTGKYLWDIPTNEQNMSAACFQDDLVFIGSYDKNIYGIDWKKGKIIWKTLLGNWIWSTPCPYKNKILIGCYDGYLYAIDQATGAISWKINCEGKIGSNPLEKNNLVFIIADKQSHIVNKYDASKENKILLVIDLKTKKVIDKFETKNEWNNKIISFDNDIYFFDSNNLYSYDLNKRKILWQIEVPEGMLAYPIITKSSIILPMNYLGHHGIHSAKILIIDRYSGKTLNLIEKIGIGIRKCHYIQQNNIVLTFEGGLNAYNIIIEK